MKAILLIILMMIPYKVTAPSDKSIVIFDRGGIDPIEQLHNATAIVESGNDQWAINVSEQAFGYLQIRGCKLIEFNNAAGKDYKPWDLFDRDVSREIFYWHSHEIGNNLESISRQWNGGPSGMRKKSTVKYFNKIKRYL